MVMLITAIENRGEEVGFDREDSEFYIDPLKSEMTDRYSRRAGDCGR